MDGCAELTELSLPADWEKEKTAYKFSPDAVPFKPKNIVSYVSSQPTDTTMQSTSGLSVNAVEFYPKNFASFNKNSVAEYSVVLKVRQAISDLTVNPADFDQVLLSLIDLFSITVHQESTLAAIVEEIFVQSMREANFRYTGARLCSGLSEQFQLESGATFQSYLVTRCLAEFDYQYQFSGENLSSIVDLVLFLSELMVNIKDIETGRVISHFPQQIVQLIFLLLGRYNQSETAMHCVIQVLKLTGAVLEEHVACLDELFVRIRAIVLDPKTSQNMRAMLVCLIELRAGNWGRNETDCSVGAGDSMADTSPDNGNQNTEQVYMSLLADETEDSSGLAGSCWVSVDEATPSRNRQGPVSVDTKTEYWAGDQAMDDETAAAYEEFMAENRSRSGVRAEHSRASYLFKGN